MAFDALALYKITKELKETILDARIDRVLQPERDEVVLCLRTFRDSFRLVLSASSAHPRVHLTEVAKKNPQTAPLFCMLLRKHLNSGKITDIEQVGFERILKISVSGYDELGDLTTKYLIIEIMGRHSNVILTNSDMKIIDCIKHIDFTVSSVREVLPGIAYTYPPKQDKTPLPDFDNETSIDFSAHQTADKAIMSAISGISPVLAREFVYKIFGTVDVYANTLNTNQTAAIRVAVLKTVSDMENGIFSPCMICEASSGKTLDFCAMNISQYETLANVIRYDSMNRLVDDFFKTRDMHERMKQKSADLNKLLSNALERAAKKRIILERTLKDAEDRDKYKIKGDLIIANIYKIRQGDKSVTADNYYDGTQMTITLDPSLTPSENAQKYYKRYNKAKTAQTEAQKQLDMTVSDLEYLESTQMAVENAESQSDLNAIRDELISEGYLNRRPVKRKQKKEEIKPLHYVSSDGFDIYVGKNNTQNDYLTLKLANSSDIWFHTKNIHGSHTIIKLGIDKSVPDSTIMEAAQLAAYYSKARNSSQVPVDYTHVKNVKKPNGAKPGMVIYDRYNTVYVTPKLIECG